MLFSIGFWAHSHCDLWGVGDWGFPRHEVSDNKKLVSKTFRHQRHYQLLSEKEQSDIKGLNTSNLWHLRPSGCVFSTGSGRTFSVLVLCDEATSRPAVPVIGRTTTTSTASAAKSSSKELPIPEVESLRGGTKLFRPPGRCCQTVVKVSGEDIASICQQSIRVSADRIIGDHVNRQQPRWRWASWVQFSSFCFFFFASLPPPPPPIYAHMHAHIHNTLYWARQVVWQWLFDSCSAKVLANGCCMCTDPCPLRPLLKICLMHNWPKLVSHHFPSSCRFPSRNDPPCREMVTATQQLLRLVENHPNGLEEMDPVQDLHIRDFELREKFDQQRLLRAQLSSLACLDCPEFEYHVGVAWEVCISRSTVSHTVKPR